MKIKGIAKQPIVSRPGDGGEGLEEVVGVVDAICYQCLPEGYQDLQVSDTREMNINL